MSPLRSISLIADESFINRRFSGVWKSFGTESIDWQKASLCHWYWMRVCILHGRRRCVFAELLEYRGDKQEIIIIIIVNSEMCVFVEYHSSIRIFSRHVYSAEKFHDSSELHKRGRQRKRQRYPGKPFVKCIEVMVFLHLNLIIDDRRDNQSHHRRHQIRTIEIDR